MVISISEDTVNCLFYTLRTNGFILGNNSGKPIEAYTFISEKMDYICVLKSEVKRIFFGLIRTIRFKKIAFIEAPHEGEHPHEWTMHFISPNPSLEKLVEKLNTACNIDILVL